ncbi:MAG: hypothetical protein H7346_23270 [Burkholderiaceae bacterium]|nr:hypothetical protein [Burkholderiaceae bacterium]
MLIACGFAALFMLVVLGFGRELYGEMGGWRWRPSAAGWRCAPVAGW